MDGWLKGRKGKKDGENWEQKNSKIFTNIHWQIISTLKRESANIQYSL